MSTVFSVLGILIGLAFGIYSIWTHRKSKRIVSLDFEKKECYNLFRKDVNRLNISVNYFDKPLSNNVILLKAALVNSGVVDIDKSRIHGDFKLIGSVKYNWLEASIISSPTGAKTNIIVESEEALKIEWDLLKKGEIIEIEALAELKNKDENINQSMSVSRFFDELSFDYRITDLDNVNKESIDNTKSKKNLFKRLVNVPLVLPILITVFGAYTVFTELNPEYEFIFTHQKVKYDVTNGNSKLTGEIEYSSTSGISLKTESDDTEIEASIEDFNKEFKITRISPKTAYKKFSWFIFIFGIWNFGMGMFIIFLDIRTISQSRKLKRLRRQYGYK